MSSGELALLDDGLFEALDRPNNPQLKSIVGLLLYTGLMPEMGRMRTLKPPLPPASAQCSITPQQRVFRNDGGGAVEHFGGVPRPG